MTTRNDILDQLKTDLEDKLHPTYNDVYLTDVAEVKRGVYFLSECPNRPTVCFHATEDVTDDFTSGNDRSCYLSVYLYGYIDTDGLGDVDPVQDLVRDVEYFLLNDFTYADNVFIDAIGISDRGAEENTSLFDMDLRIHYMNEL